MAYWTWPHGDTEDGFFGATQCYEIDGMCYHVSNNIVTGFCCLQPGDGGDGGGIILGDAAWAKSALHLAEEAIAEFNGDLSIFAFKAWKDPSRIHVRLDKLSDKYVPVSHYLLYSLFLQLLAHHFPHLVTSAL